METKRPWGIVSGFVALAAVALVVSLAGPALQAVEPADGKLSAKRWQEVQQRLLSALKDQSWGELAQALGEAAEDGSARAVSVVCKVLGKAGPPDDLATPGEAALSKLATSGSAARQAVKRALSKDRSWRVRILLLEAISGTAQEAEDWAAVEQALHKDRQDEVRIAAAQILGRSRRDEAIDPLIVAMEKLDKKRGSVWEALRAELARLTGANMDAGIDYRNYWEGRKANPDAPPPDGGCGGGMGTVTLFGRKIHCQRVVFIIDISGSMLSIDPMSQEELRTSPRGGELDPNRTRMKRAQRELVKVLRGLPKSTKFNIVSYSSDVDFFRPEGLHSLNGPNTDAAVKWVEGLESNGVTVTDYAIESAFDQIEGARCFYLLSDGFATHDGKTPVATDVILNMIREKNRFRRVAIHTLGFMQADRAMMQAVAKETGGTYSDIK